MSSALNKFIASEIQHLNFLMGSFLSGVLKINNASLVYSDALTDSDWNYATQFDKSFLSQNYNLDAIKTFYKERALKPAVYITPYNYDINLITRLEALYFKSEFNDVWMYYQGGVFPQQNVNSAVQIQVVQTSEQQSDFFTVFFAAYHSEEESNFYHVDDSYKIPLLRMLSQATINNVHAVVAYLNTTPVGCAVLIYNKLAAGIYCVGVNPRYRQDGIGRSLINDLVNHAQTQNVSEIFLLTEKNSPAERFYEKINFKTEFICHGFVLQD